MPGTKSGICFATRRAEVSILNTGRIFDPHCYERSLGADFLDKLHDKIPPACSTLGFNIGNLDKLAKLAILSCVKGRPSMSTLTFRNRQGALVDIPTVKATQVKNEFGSILERAMRSGAVAITRHATPKAVLISYEEFESLVQVQSRTLENLGTEFDDLLDRMQTPKAKTGMESAFHASPAKLGRAAIRAARKGR